MGVVYRLALNAHNTYIKDKPHPFFLVVRKVDGKHFNKTIKGTMSFGREPTVLAVRIVAYGSHDAIVNPFTGYLEHNSQNHAQLNRRHVLRPWTILHYELVEDHREAEQLCTREHCCLHGRYQLSIDVIEARILHAAQR